MTKTIFLCSLIACTVPSVLKAQNDNSVNNDGNKKYEFVKNKSVSKTYSVSSNDKLTVSNSFGSVDVHTWNKNEIKVEVAIETSSNKEATAQRILDGISISENQSGGEVSFKTSIKGNDNGKNGKSSMNINYNIYMPESNQLNLKNEFGSIVVPDFKGKVDLSSKFGSLKTGHLTDIKHIEVEFGKGEFESLANGSVTVKYSSAEFNKLVGNIKLNLEFCGGTKINIDNSLTSLDIKLAYSTLNLQPTDNLSGAYSISTSFGSFKNKTAIKFDSDDEEDDNKSPKFDFQYDGKAGSGNVPVKIKSSFSTIILGEASEDELNGKQKSKSKKKTS